MGKTRFAMSFSCGKDSTLALHKMIEQQYEPTALITIINKDNNRSFFHGVSTEILKRMEQALGIPVIAMPSDGNDYHIAMETALTNERLKGAEYACFGDIDIEGHREWAELHSGNVGLKAVFPLWQRSRAENVRELVALGYKCVVKTIDNRLLPRDILGKVIDENVLRIMEDCGIDICGENGEYHTLVVDGPIFQQPLPYLLGEIMDFGHYSVIDVK